MYASYKMILLPVVLLVAVPFGLASLARRSITQSLMDDFERFILFAEGADQLACPMPDGATLVKQVRAIDKHLSYALSFKHYSV